MPILGRPRCDPGLLVKLFLGSRSLVKLFLDRRILGMPILSRPSCDPGLLVKAVLGSKSLGHPYWAGRDRARPIGKDCAGQQELGNTHTVPAELRPAPINKA